MEPETRRGWLRLETRRGCDRQRPHVVLIPDHLEHRRYAAVISHTFRVCTPETSQRFPEGPELEYAAVYRDVPFVDLNAEERDGIEKAGKFGRPCGLRELRGSI
jgi:hypothetical protein